MERQMNNNELKREVENLHSELEATKEEMKKWREWLFDELVRARVTIQLGEPETLEQWDELGNVYYIAGERPGIPYLDFTEHDKIVCNTQFKQTYNISDLNRILAELNLILNDLARAGFYEAKGKVDE